MSRELMRHPQILDYSTIWMDSIRDGAFELVNTNKLLKRYEGCTGLKTGFTSAAMYCLSAVAERQYMAVVMHGDSIDSRNADATALLNYGFSRFELCPLRPEEALPAMPVELGAADIAALRVEGEAAALVPKGSGTPDYTLSLPGRVTAPVEEGQILGTLTVTLGGETLAELPVAAAEAVSRIGLFPLFTRLLGSLLGL